VQQLGGTEILGRVKADAKWEVTAEEVDAEINRLSQQIQELDSTREVDMILLNQMINSKGQMVTQATTLLRAAHESARTIVANMRDQRILRLLVE
jgi:hypothetical protein